MADDDWWSKKQACRHLEITPKTFERYANDGMPTVIFSRRVFVRRDIIQAEYRRRKLADKANRAKTDR